MIRSRLAAAAPALVVFLALSGCPIPQPLPDYPPGQPISPPRIVVDDTVRAVSPADTVVRVPALCVTAPVFSLQADLRHELTNEAVSARWFVDYDPSSQQRSAYLNPGADEIRPPDASAADPTLRTVPAFHFRPYDFAPIPGTGSASSTPGAVNVVELVVSNGFDAAYDQPPPAVDLPYRKPRLNFEVQLYRWVFITTPESAADCTGAACVRCPSSTTPL